MRLVLTFKGLGPERKVYRLDFRVRISKMVQRYTVYCSSFNGHSVTHQHVCGSEEVAEGVVQ